MEAVVQGLGKVAFNTEIQAGAEWALDSIATLRGAQVWRPVVLPPLRAPFVVGVLS